MQHLVELLGTFAHPKVTVVGDLILDRYVFGSVERINPEAPVPVLRQERTESVVGGAGKVTAAVQAFDAQALIIGVAGRDSAGDELLKLLRETGAKTSSVLRLPDRPTAVKTRYVGLAQHRHAQQMLRVDDEAKDPLPGDVQHTIRSAVRGELAGCDIVLLEDYNKGVLTNDNTPQIIADARRAGRPVIVDPACIDDFRRYRGATVIKPNRYEAALASGVRITDDESLEAAARRLLAIVDGRAVIVTLDREGMYLCPVDGPSRRIPHYRPRQVYDVTGAGDETVAVLASAIAAGATYEQAAELGNVAGGLEVEQAGFIPITRHQMIDELRGMIGLRGEKVLSREALAVEVAHRRQAGDRIVFTNGCFDLLHMGHVRYLQQARELGGCLVVAVNSDDSVRRLKGAGRPVIGQKERAAVLAALECIDYITIFEEDTPLPLLERLRPDVLVKGGTTDVVVGKDLVEGYGGTVATLDKVEDFSTTRIIERIIGSGSKP